MATHHSLSPQWGVPRRKKGQQPIRTIRDVAQLARKDQPAQAAPATEPRQTYVNRPPIRFD